MLAVTSLHTYEAELEPTMLASHMVTGLEKLDPSATSRALFDATVGRVFQHPFGFLKRPAALSMGDGRPRCQPLDCSPQAQPPAQTLETLKPVVLGG